MKFSPDMNALLEFPADFVFDKNTAFLVHKKNFEPKKPVPPPNPSPVFYPDKFVYVLCDLVETQILGDRQLSALTVLLRETNTRQCTRGSVQSPSCAQKTTSPLHPNTDHR